MIKLLYISYDGMTDPLGQSQVIPYLKGLSERGYFITLLSFEKKEKFEKLSSHIQSIMDKVCIKWKPLMFTRRPPILSKLYDIWQLKKAVNALYEEEQYDFIHCRSYVAAGAALPLWKKHRVPFLFDMRGFWVDERVDNGQWNLKNPLYKYFYKTYKKKEKDYFRESKHIISLTWKGKDELVNVYGVPEKKVTVIPCCVDMQHFDYRQITEEEKKNKREQIGIAPGTPVITYLGSLGSWYMVKEMLDFFREMKKKITNARFLFITQDSPGSLYQLAEQAGVTKESLIVLPASRNEVPLYLAISDCSIFFIKDAYSKRASSPTKQGEIMAMGVPLICNDIGDTGKIILDSGTGVLVKSFSVSEYDKAIQQFQQLMQLKKEDMRAAAHKYYDLIVGIRRYDEVYKGITGKE